ncbi:G-type lectin S-receptor-like serine/threonine-protein kinase RKS1 [Prosopis cineraria]|uniref:G-type lectin S-receptor-like serine/threonine-protein kinase RKS1 n=1 Tax=Prosopis cineraria TaxID=364024 RepID=UPI00240F676B|nr:G-type lectin S-receptor-like serine/threonine-protein kinase RKS1 [Prosopis cineraria]
MAMSCSLMAEPSPSASFTPNNNSRKRFVGLTERILLTILGGVLLINKNGNIVLVHNETNVNGHPIWSSNISSTFFGDTFAKLQDTGNFVLTRNGGEQEVQWQSFDYPHDAHISVMKLAVDRKTGFNWVYTSWKSPDDPGLGNVSLIMDPTGYPQAFMYINGAPFWRGGSWTGQRLSGIPEMTTNFIFNISFVDNGSEVSFTYSVMDPSIYIRTVVNHTGHVTRSIWQAKENKWLQIWFTPREDCDKYRWCGSNCNCDPYNTYTFECVCLPGFEPTVRVEY